MGWEAVGGDRLRRVAVENEQHSHNQWGPDKASFDLRRDPEEIFPDLRGGTPVKIEVGGELAWGGRITETPIVDDQDRVINVQCEGWQYHLDDDVLQRSWVHAKMSDWVDYRSLLQADLTTYRAAANVTTDKGLVTLSWPTGSTLTATDRVGVMLDLGQADAKRVVFTWDCSNNFGAGSTCQIFGSDDPSFTTVEAGGSFLMTGAASGTTPTTFTTSRRYLLIRVIGAAATLAADVWVRLKSILVFRDTAYESGNASILTADTPVKDVLAFCPLLSTDTSQIQAGSFQIPDFAPDGYKTPREIIDAANAFENRITMVDEQARLVFKARPTSPVIARGSRSGGGSKDDSSNSLADIYNRVIVEGTGPDGAQLNVERTAAQQPGAMLFGITSPAPDNSGFETNTTSWTPGGTGTIVRDTTSHDTGVASGKFTPDAANPILTETFTGTFKKGVAYRLALALASPPDPNATARLDFGLLGTDQVSLSTPIYGGAAYSTFVLTWRPSADRTGVTLRIRTVSISNVDSLDLRRAVPTLPDRIGYSKAYILQTDAAISTAVGQKWGDLFLANHKTTPFKGSASLTGQRACWDARTGAGIHPAHVGRRVNQLMRFEDRIDPDTGGRCRNGQVATVSYVHADSAAEVAIDDTRANFEALLARYAVVMGAGR
jgi:hypothetical protein